MQKANAYYRHSGKVGPLGLPLMAGAALAASLPIAAIYGYLVALNPFIYINFIGTIIASAAVGGLVGLMAKPGQVRNMALTGGMGFLAGCVFVVTQWWATFQYYEVDVSLTDPAAIWDAVLAFATLGPWTLFGVEPGKTGFMVIWGIEALMIVGLSALAAVGVADEPFCERCSTWVDDTLEVGPFDAVTAVEALTARLDRGDASMLTAFERSENAERHAVIQLKECATCKMLKLADVKNVEISVDDDGKSEKNETLVAGNVILDQGEYEAISKL